MNKTVLKKIAYELKNELKDDITSFIFSICLKYLDIQGISNKEEWLRKILNFNGNINDKAFEILNDCSKEEFENPESIGWLYQYFISDEKSRVFENLKNNVKVEKDDIPYATQLFTPDWIVKYLVENSLGRFTRLQDEFKYYIPVKYEDILENKSLDDIKFIDPCCGTGHILIYAFEIFFKSYIKNGVSKEIAVKNILTKNIFGVDIDENACKITKILLILKAGSIYSGVFGENYINDMNIICIKNSKNLSKKKYGEIVEVFEDADEYGSLLKMKKFDLPKEDKNIFEFLKQYKILNDKYDVVCTNPPYMGRKNINNKLKDFLKKEYPDTKSEMYSSFIERCLDFTNENGYLSMITIHSWLFISSFKNLRSKILNSGSLLNMLHSGAGTFDDLSSFNALAVSFVLKKKKLNLETCFVRLADYYNLKEKIKNFKNKENYYYLNQNRFFEIPNQPFIYWISEKLRNCFKENKRLDDFYDAKQGLATGNNKEFVKLWFEVPYSEIAFNCKSQEEFFETKKVYSLYNKGGIYRKWYGNLDYVIKFNEENYSKLLNQGNHLPSRKCYFNKGITWSLFGFENFGVRYKDYGYVFDVSGSSMFPKDEDLYYVIGYLSSNVCFKFLSCLAPTVNFQVGNIESLPFKIIDDRKIRNRIDELVKENIEICKEEWSFYETNIEFKVFPLAIKKFRKENLEKTLCNFENYYNNLRNKLRKNEEEINKIFSEIFDIQEEIDISVNDRDLTLKPIDRVEFIKLFLSYCVGCSLGRFDYKNCKTNYEKTKYEVDLDIMDKNLEDILIDMFGEKSLNENLNFIMKILDVKSIKNYYEKSFLKEHQKQYLNISIYKKKS